MDIQERLNSIRKLAGENRSGTPHERDGLDLLLRLRLLKLKNICLKLKNLLTNYDSKVRIIGGNIKLDNAEKCSSCGRFYGEGGCQNPDCDIAGSGKEAAEDSVLTGRSAEVQAVYDNARANEKLITQELYQITNDVGGELTGLEFSVKTASSVNEKIERLMQKNQSIGMTEEEAINSMRDLVRYTQEVEHDNIAQAHKNTVAELTARGYKLTEVDNKWLVDGNEYRGLHSTFESPHGQPFELQFHSPVSMAVKNRNHKLYEEFRRLSTPETRRRELAQEMIANTQRMPVPKEIESIICWP